MTYPVPSEEICAVCGETVTTWHYIAYTVFYSDLDGQPRGTGINPHFSIVHQCGKCGYVAFNMSTELPGVEELLKSDKYREVMNAGFSLDAQKFICRSIIEEWLGNEKDAGYCLFRATWALGKNQGNEHRVKACELMLKYLPEMEEDKQWGNALAVADVYRQASEFSKAKEICEEWIEKVDKKKKDYFQQELDYIASFDIDRHRPSGIFKDKE